LSVQETRKTNKTMNNEQPKDTGDFPGENSAAVEKLAAHYGFSHDAANTLLRSLIAGGGTMAQFSHPELGGTGQWTSGGMIMIGDMFNNALKARVDSLCSELANLLKVQETKRNRHPFASNTEKPRENWWGTDLGPSSASGSQNDMRYAYFPATQRLAVLNDDRLTIYDAGTHNITGVSQQQNSRGLVTFRSQHGLVNLADLSIISAHSTDRPSREAQESMSNEVDRGEDVPAGSKQEASSKNSSIEPPPDIFYKIERLADMRDKGILSDEEFLSKKIELLARL
jgi:Short C-terminal domain